MSAPHLIVAPPPTPNGDLHVGHLAGPYLAADIYKRSLAQRGERAFYAVSTDDHQSYVDTTAARLGTTADALIEQARAEIGESFRTYSIGLDCFGRPNESYAAFVTQFFTALCDAGFVSARIAPVLFDRRDGVYPVEAFVSGYCPHCLEPTCGGICEACGHPNECVNLLGLDRDRYEVRHERRLFLDVERFRPELDERIDGLACRRPALRRLTESLLAGPLDPFCLTYVTRRGIDATPLGAAGQRLNVWAEMFPGHMFWLTQLAGHSLSDARYVQFLGFDNSYFYVVVHLALALAARRCGREWPIPAALVTNQFYYLEAGKFSTSKRHAVWARDLAAECNPDLTRLFLALHGPEYQEAAFTRGLFDLIVSDLARQINGLAAAYNDARHRPSPPHPGSVPEVVGTMCRTLPLDEHSSAALARRAVDVIGYLEHLVRCGGDGATVPAAMALALELFCPTYAEALRREFGFGKLGWGSLARANTDRAIPPLEVRR